MVLELGSWMVLDYSASDGRTMRRLHAPDVFQPAWWRLRLLWRAPPGALTGL